MRFRRLIGAVPRGWRIYLALVLISQAVQLVWSGPWPAAHVSPGTQVTELPRFNGSGEVSGRPVRVAYHESGPANGPAVILLHGSPGVAANFDFLVPLLFSRYRVIVPDLPGFGQSEAWIPDYSIKAHARYVLALMDRLGVDRAHVVGFSMGSGVALEMADLAPARVASVTLYGGIGIQEGEGSGSYGFEHLKYAAGYATLVIGPEVTPSFGLLGGRQVRHTFIRNFWDTDQRPLRRILEHLRPPLLILHGKDDPLVPAWVAEEHHRIVPTSEYVLFDASHSMLFERDRTKLLADEMLPFFTRHDDPGAPAVPRTVRHAPVPERPMNAGLGAWSQAGTLAAATLASEDLTCIAAGQLIGRRMVDPFVGLFGCVMGIYLGDLGLWLGGRLLGRRLLHWGWLARRLPEPEMARLGEWFERHPGRAMFAARFLPGTRLPICVAAGVLRLRVGRLAFWSLLATIIRTLALVLLAAFLGDVFIAPFRRMFGNGWAVLPGMLCFFMAVRVVTMLSTRRGRRRVAAVIAKLCRWTRRPSRRRDACPE